jgi:hypothetical protein
MNIQNIQNIVNDDDFKEVLKSIIDVHMETITNSNASDTYHKIAAVKELIGSLEAIAAGQAIDENRFKIL